MTYGLIWRVIICLLFLTPYNVFAAPTKPLDTVTLQLKWKHQFQFAGYYAAIAKGYYQDAGLQVVLREGRPGMKPADELVSGRADFAVYLPDMLIARQQGQPIVALAAIFQHSPLAMFTGKSSGITNPQDLIGKKLMARVDGNAEIFAMLSREGIKKSQLMVIPHSWNVDEMISGQVDAITGYLTDMPFILQKHDFDSLTISPLTYGIDFYGDCLFTTEKEISEHPERVKNFLAASIKGWEYAMAHPQEIVDLIYSQYSVRLSIPALRYEAEATRKLMQPKFIEIGHMNPGRWKHIADTFVELGMLAPDYSLKGFLYNPQQQRYAKTRRTILIMFFVVGAIIMIAIILLIFNRKLQQLVAGRTKELEAERSFSEAIINTLPGHFFVYEDGERLVRWNQAMQQATGLTDAEMLGHTPLDFIAKRDQEKVTQAMQTTFKNSEGAVEAVTILQDKEYPYYHTLTLLKRDGTTYLLGVAFDLTERKRLEEQLRQAQKMESIGRLAGGVAHDFNNVLSSILGYSELVLDQMVDNDPYREEITIIHSAGERAATLVRQLLAFSRKQILAKKVVGINSIITDLLKILGKTLGEDVVIKTFLEATDGNINADTGQIEQVIMNLAVNARDAMPGGGEIIIETRDLVLADNYTDSHPDVEPGSYVIMTISDNGEGMDREVQEHIFDPFYTTKEQGKGTGLGLATVHGIIKQHSGHIYVYSEENKGTTFKIYLPAAKQTIVTSSVEREKTPLASGHETIMVVDDEPTICRIIVDTLAPLGYKCIGAANGEEALAVFKSYPGNIHLLLTDVVMPGMSGRELAEKICGRQPDIKVIFMSGYTENTIAHHGVLDLGINYISKPITPLALTQKIRSVLDDA